MQPTFEQLKELYRISVELTSMYAPIYLVRLDKRTSNVILLAGEEIEVYQKHESEFPRPSRATNGRDENASQVICAVGASTVGLGDVSRVMPAIAV